MDSLAFAVVVLATLLFTNIYAGLQATGITARSFAGDPDAHAGWRIGLSLIGTVVGGGMFLAVGQIGYEAGVVGAYVGVAYLTGFTLAAVVAGRLRQTLTGGGQATILDVLETRYSSRVALQFAVVNLLMYLFLLSGQFLALYQFADYAAGMSTHRWVPWALVGAGFISMSLYTVIGGLKKDILADTVQVAVIVVASVVIISGMYTSNSIDVMCNLPRTHFTGSGYGPIFLVGVALFLPPSFLVRMDVWQRVRAARSTKAVQIAFVMAGSGSLAFYLLFTCIGMWARATGQPSAKIATLDVIVANFRNPFVLGLVIGGLFAAVLSSADTYINNGSIFLARLTHASLWRSAASDEGGADPRLLFWERLFSLVIIALGASLALAVGDFVDLLVGALSLLLIYLLPIVGVLFPKFANELAAFYSSTLAAALFVVLFFFWNPKIAFAPAVLFAAVIYLAIVSVALYRQSKKASG